jgi:hypothetical protein
MTGLRRRIATAVIALPGTVVVLVPSLILLASRRTQFHPRPATPLQPRFWLAVLLGAFGLFFGMWSMSLFARSGDGTPAPWDPPQRLVVQGP